VGSTPTATDEGQAVGGVDEGAVAAVGQGRVDEGTTTSAMEEGAVGGREESSGGGPQPPHALLLDE